MSAVQSPRTFDNSVGPQVREGRDPHRRVFALLFVLILLASSQVATQLCARDFAYQPALGCCFGRLYPPWAIVAWAARWGSLYPSAFRAAANAGLLATAVGMMSLVAVKLALVRANPYLHGSARWSNEFDIRQAGLLGSRDGLLQRLLGSPQPS
ncbi:MAG TPA: hypothetical protein VF331_00220, partial [Polyangiales bacterium]